MKSLKLFCIMAIGALMMVSCNKPEGDEIPVVDNTVGINVDSVTVFALSTNSELGTMLDKVVLEYGKVTEMNDSVMELDTVRTVSWQDVMLKKDAPFRDTLWEMKPDTLYAYRVYMEDLASSDTSDWKIVTTLNPGLPTVSADSAMMVNDTLWLYGSVTSWWRALMAQGGMESELRFHWGTTQDNVNDNSIDATIVKDTLIDGKLMLNIMGPIVSEEFPNAQKVYYKVYAKHAWGDGEKYSVVKEITVTPSKSE